MNAIKTTLPTEATVIAPGASAWIKQHPLLAYFLMAFAGTWFFFAPILFSQKGLGLINLPDEAYPLSL